MEDVRGKKSGHHLANYLQARATKKKKAHQINLIGSNNSVAVKQLHGAPVVPRWDLSSVSLLGKPRVKGALGETGFVDPCEPMDIAHVIPMSSPCCNPAVPYAIGRGLGRIAEGESQSILKNRKRRLGMQHGQGWELTCGCQGEGGHLELPQMFPRCSIHASYRDIHPKG